jgi:F0F1-type ATP synthase assembly protein I
MTRPSDESDRPAEPASGPAKQSEADILTGWYRMAGVGIEFVVAVALFAGIGYAVDRWRGSSPWGLLIGAGLGFAVGLRAMIRVARRAFKQ